MILKVPDHFENQKKSKMDTMISYYGSFQKSPMKFSPGQITPSIPNKEPPKMTASLIRQQSCLLGHFTAHLTKFTSTNHNNVINQETFLNFS